MTSWVRYSVAVYVGLLMAGMVGEQHPYRTPGPRVHDQPISAPYRMAAQTPVTRGRAPRRHNVARFAHHQGH